MRKRVWVVMVVTLIMASIPNFVFAGTEIDIPIDGEISVEYAYASNVAVTLTISDSGTAKATSSIQGLPGTATRLSVTMYLQRYSNGTWETVQKWNKSTTANILNLSKSKIITKGEYRTHSVFKAYYNSKIEKIEKNSKLVKY